LPLSTSADAHGLLLDSIGNAAAAGVELTQEDMARIDAELPRVAGERYNEAGMASVNL